MTDICKNALNSFINLIDEDSIDNYINEVCISEYNFSINNEMYNGKWYADLVSPCIWLDINDETVIEKTFLDFDEMADAINNSIDDYGDSLIYEAMDYIIEELTPLLCLSIKRIERRCSEDE